MSYVLPNFFTMAPGPSGLRSLAILASYGGRAVALAKAGTARRELTLTPRLGSSYPRLGVAAGAPHLPYPPYPPYPPHLPHLPHLPS